jgi:hypothetical protein
VDAHRGALESVATVVSRVHRTVRRIMWLPAVFLTWPGPVTAQQADAWSPRLEMRGGLARHGAGGCNGSGTGVTAGIAVNAGHEWLAAGSVDLLDVVRLGSGLCEASLRIIQYQGQLVTESGNARLDRGAPRLALAVGRRFSIAGMRSEVSAGGGTVSTQGRWRPWFGGTLTARAAGGPALQVEYGRHRLEDRYYLYDQPVLVARFHRWEDMWRLGVSLPLIS